MVGGVIEEEGLVEGLGRRLGGEGEVGRLGVRVEARRRVMNRVC